MRNYLILGLWLLLSGVVTAQRIPGQLASDTTTANRPMVRPDLRLGPDGRPYIVTPTGVRMPQPTAADVASKLDNITNPVALSAYIGNQTQAIIPSYGTYNLVTSSAAIDGVTTLSAVGQSNKRWIINLPDRKLPPELFGAIANDGLDDFAALQAWANVAGNWGHNLPDGNIYNSSGNVTRINKGAFTLTGRGQIIFTGDTDGLTVVNPLNGNYGAVVINGPKFVSGGTKSAGRTAVTVTTQHEQRPGPNSQDVTIQSLTTGQEWTKGYYLFDCSGSVTTNLDVQSASLSVCTGMAIGNSTNRPSVEHSITHLNARNAKLGLGVLCASTGGNGVEGVQLNSANLVNLFQCVNAKSFQSSPHITINAGHFQSTGGEAIYVDGYQQVEYNNPLIYSFKDAATGVTPPRSVYMNNAVTVKGSMTINLSDNTPYAVELAGSGGVIDLDVQNITSAAPTNLVNVAVGYTGGVLMGLSRTWTGATVYGTTQGGAITDPGNNIRIKMYVAPGSFTPADKSGLRYDLASGLWRAITPVQNTVFGDGIYVTATQTLDPSANNLFRIDNGSNNITLTLDATKYIAGEKLVFLRQNETSTGTITITTNNTTNNQIMGTSGQLATTFTLPLTGQRAALFYSDGTHLRLISGGYSLGTLSSQNASAVQLTGALTFAAGTGQNRITTAGTEAILEQTGDALGGSRLTVQNRGGGGIGAVLENTGIGLTELAFKNTVGANAIRYESRGGGNTILPGNNTSGAWQIFTNNSSPRISFEHGVGGTFMDRLVMGDNGNHPSAILAMTSTTQGLLPPRMSTSQRSAINSPEQGLEVYNLTTNVKESWNGNVWATTFSGSRGTATFTGNGSTTRFAIPHGLGVKPAYFNAVAQDAPSASGLVMFQDRDATNGFINFSSAPANGTTLTYVWLATF